MFIIILIILILIVIPLVQYVLIKKGARINIFIVCLSWLLFFYGLYLTYNNSHVIQDYYDEERYMLVKGIVEKAVVAGDEKAFYPEITYRYEIDSIAYTKVSKINAPMFGNKHKQHDFAQKTINQYPTGKEIKVRVDRYREFEAELYLPLAWNIYGKLGFGVCLILISIVILSLDRKYKSILNRQGSADTPTELPDSPGSA